MHFDEKRFVYQAQQELPYVTKSYEILMLHHQNKILAICKRILLDEHLAEDATQNTMLKIFHHIKKFQYESAFSTWIYAIARNESLQILKKNKKIYHEDIESLYEEINILEFLEIERIYELLNEEETELLQLKYESELTNEQIAEQLGISLSACKMRIKRLLEKLNQHFGE